MRMELTPASIQRFIRRRQQLKLTLPELSVRSGVSLRTIQYLESGRRTSFSESTLLCLCRTLDLNYNDLLLGEEAEAGVAGATAAQATASISDPTSPNNCIQEKTPEVLETAPETQPAQIQCPPHAPQTASDRKRGIQKIIKISVGIVLILAIFFVYQGVSRNGILRIVHPQKYQRKDWVNPDDKKEFPQEGLFSEADWQNAQKVNYIEMKHYVRSGEIIPVRIKWSYFYPNGKPMVYVSAYAEWDPDREIRVFDGILREKGNEIRQFELISPQKTGIYRIRFFYALAYAPVTSFYGTPPDDQDTSPSATAYAEMTLEVLPK